MIFFKKRMTCKETHYVLGEAILDFCFVESENKDAKEYYNRAKDIIRQAQITRIQYHRKMFGEDILKITCVNPVVIIGRKGGLIEHIKEFIKMHCHCRGLVEPTIKLTENLEVHDVMNFMQGYPEEDSYQWYKDQMESAYFSSTEKDYYEKSQDAEYMENYEEQELQSLIESEIKEG